MNKNSIEYKNDNINNNINNNINVNSINPTVEYIKKKSFNILLLTSLFSTNVFWEEENIEKVYTKYNAKLNITKIQAKINIRFLTKEQLNFTWNNRKFIKYWDKHKSYVHAFVIHDDDWVCNIYAPLSKKGWNDEHMLRELWHEVLHCLWGKHE